MYYILEADQPPAGFERQQQAAKDAVKSDGWALGDFRVKRCPRGGFVVLDDCRDMGMASAPIASFSTAGDLLAWLHEQLEPAEQSVVTMPDGVRIKPGVPIYGKAVLGDGA